MGEQEAMFEAGQRVQVGGVAAILVTRCHENRSWLCCTKFHDILWAEDWMAWHDVKVMAPAPKPGQRWWHGMMPTLSIVDADGKLVAERMSDGHVVVCDVGVVELAAWLMNGDYKCICEPVTASDMAETDEELRARLLVKSVGLRTAEMYTATGVDLDQLAAGWRIKRRCPTDTRSRGDISALRPLAEAVASIFRQPTREQSRRYVDEAVRQLRSEPFAKAIQAVLVSLSDCLTLYPECIVSAIAAARAWEKRRGDVATGRRTLTTIQFAECYNAAVAAGVCWYWSTGDVYKRARATC